MRSERGEAPPAEYGTEQFKGDLRTGCNMELRNLEHELKALDEADANILETGPQRVRFEQDKKGLEESSQEIVNSANGLIDRELERERIQRRIEATKRVLEKLSK